MKHRVCMRDTDATGRLYFTSAFNWCQAAFEEFLVEKGLPISQILESDYHSPIVHAEGDFKKALQVTDLVEVRIQKIETYEKTFDITYGVFDEKGDLTFHGKITHCCVDRSTGRACKLAPQFKKLFS